LPLMGMASTPTGFKTSVCLLYPLTYPIMRPHKAVSLFIMESAELSYAVYTS